MNYALFAESEYLIKKTLNKLLLKLNEHYESEFIEYDGSTKDFSLDELLLDLNTFSLFNEHRIILLKNPLFLSAKGSLSDSETTLFGNYLLKPSESATLIIVVDQFKVDRRKKISKLVMKQCEVSDLETLDQRDMEHIIERDLKEHHFSMDHLAKNELFKRMLGSFENWESELEKIILYNKEHLSYDDINVLISSNESDNIFDLTNAVLARNLVDSFNVYNQLEIKAKEPIALTMLLASQFRLVYQVSTLLKQRMDNKSIASELKVHPYRVQIASGLARKYDSFMILSILNKLANLEQNIKNSTIIPEIGFELFLVEVCQA